MFIFVVEGKALELCVHIYYISIQKLLKIIEFIFNVALKQGHNQDVIN